MAENKTHATDASVDTFLHSVEPEQRRLDGIALDALFRATTGWAPVMWGDSIVGYGQYHYRYDSGREGDFLATGFSPRKSKLSLYIMPGYAEMADMLIKLGKHKRGKACLYINKLDDVDLTILKQIIQAGLDDLSSRYPVVGS